MVNQKMTTVAIQEELRFQESIYQEHLKKNSPYLIRKLIRERIKKLKGELDNLQVKN